MPLFRSIICERANADRAHLFASRRVSLSLILILVSGWPRGSPGGARHSTYEQAVADLQKFIDAGIPRGKLILGIPFYGRKITAPYEETTYAEIIERYHPVPNVDEVDGIFFNGIETVQLKTCHAMSENIGGVMIWELAQDTMDKTSLLAAIKRAVFDGCK